MILEKLKALFRRQPINPSPPPAKRASKRVKRTKKANRPKPTKPSIFTLDKRIISALERMAAKENRSAADVAHDLLDEGIRRRRSADAWLRVWHELTPREKQAAGLTCLGYTNDQIAQQMTISPNTVKTYVKKILFQFKVNSKTELRDLLEDWDFSEWVEGSLKQ